MKKLIIIDVTVRKDPIITSYRTEDVEFEIPTKYKSFEHFIKCLRKYCYKRVGKYCCVALYPRKCKSIYCCDTLEVFYPEFQKRGMIKDEL